MAFSSDSHSAKILDNLLTQCSNAIDSRDEEVLRTLTVPIPRNEKQRLEAINELSIMDTDTNELAFDRIIALMSRHFQVN